jgi:hypothetical protein
VLSPEGVIVPELLLQLHQRRLAISLGHLRNQSLVYSLYTSNIPSKCMHYGKSEDENNDRIKS